MNEACRQPAMNLEIARVYLHHSDASYSTRTWQHVMDEMSRQKTGGTKKRWDWAMQGAAFDLIRNRILIRTTAQDFLDLLTSGTVSTNVFLRRLHNYAFDMEWIPKAIIPCRQWAEDQIQSEASDYL